jgi:ATP-dependent Lhr-like helicase
LHQRIPMAASLLQQTLLQLEVKGVAFQFKKDQWIERNHLAQLRKMQLNQTRRSIKALSTDAYQDFLADWQFITKPAVGIEGLGQVLRQWQGFATQASAWEEEIIKPRVQDYHGMMLDMLCQSGQFIWKRAKAKLVSKDLNQMTIQKTRFTFLEKQYAHLFPAHEEQKGQNIKCKMVEQILSAHGALFFRELLEISGLLPIELEQVLIQLIKQGLVVADGFQALRVFSQSPAERRRQLQKAKKYANNLGYLEMMGRWSLLPQKSVQPAEYIKLMLSRYGILSYDIWKQEDMPIKWRKVSFELQRMEARGELLAGRFIENMEGMQYALPVVYKKINDLILA